MELVMEFGRKIAREIGQPDLLKETVGTGPVKWGVPIASGGLSLRVSIKNV